MKSFGGGVLASMQRLGIPPAVPGDLYVAHRLLHPKTNLVVPLALWSWCGVCLCVCRLAPWDPACVPFSGRHRCLMWALERMESGWCSGVRRPPSRAACRFRAAHAPLCSFFFASVAFTLRHRLIRPLTAVSAWTLAAACGVCPQLFSSGSAWLCSPQRRVRVTSGQS